VHMRTANRTRRTRVPAHGVASFGVTPSVLDWEPKKGHVVMVDEVEMLSEGGRHAWSGLASS
jgi:hypothetical protein